MFRQLVHLSSLASLSLFFIPALPSLLSYRLYNPFLHFPYFPRYKIYQASLLSLLYSSFIPIVYKSNINSPLFFYLRQQSVRFRSHLFYMHIVSQHLWNGSSIFFHIFYSSRAHTRTAASRCDFALRKKPFHVRFTMCRLHSGCTQCTSYKLCASCAQCARYMQALSQCIFTWGKEEVAERNRLLHLVALINPRREDFPRNKYFVDCAPVSSLSRTIQSSWASPFPSSLWCRLALRERKDGRRRRISESNTANFARGIKDLRRKRSWPENEFAMKKSRRVFHAESRIIGGSSSKHAGTNDWKVSSVSYEGNEIYCRFCNYRYNLTGSVRDTKFPTIKNHSFESRLAKNCL